MKLAFCIAYVALLGVPAAAQSSDPELKGVAEMARRCREESVKFRDAGGRPGDPSDPALKWSAALWQYSKDHPGTPAAVQATASALSWLRHADQDREVIARARNLPLDFPAWGSVIDGLRQSSIKAGDYTAFFDISRRLLERSKDNKVRASVQLALGRVYQERGQDDKATTAFDAVLQEAPKSPQAEDAELLLHEMRELRVGRKVPAFEATTIDGKRVSSADFRGKVVLLNFWATW